MLQYVYHYYTILENFRENKCAQEFCHSSDEKIKAIYWGILAAVWNFD